MNRTDNKSMIRRFIEDGLNKLDAALIDEVYSADYVGHDPDRPTPRTAADLKQGFGGLLGKIFANPHYSIERLVTEGELVVWHWTFRAAHAGEIMGIPPTGKQLEFGGVNIFRFENGKVVEDWVYRDTVGMMRQLGALPAPAPAQK